MKNTKTHRHRLLYLLCILSLAVSLLALVVPRQPKPTLKDFAQDYENSARFDSLNTRCDSIESLVLDSESQPESEE